MSMKERSESVERTEHSSSGRSPALYFAGGGWQIDEIASVIYHLSNTNELY